MTRGRASYRTGAAFGAVGFVAMALLGVVSGILIARIYGASVVGQYALVMAPVNVVWYLSSARERPAFVRELAVLDLRAPRVTGLFYAVFAFSATLTLVVAALTAGLMLLVFEGPLDQPALVAPILVNLAGYVVFTNTSWNLDAVFSGFRAASELFWIRLHQAVMFLALAIGVGLADDSVWSLVIATVGAAATSLVHRLIAIRPYMAAWTGVRALIGGFRTLPDLIRFGLKMVPGSLANGASTEIATWTLGATAPVAVLGAYSRAWLLARRLIEVNWRITEMLFPTLVERRASGDGAGFDRALVDTMRYCAAGLLLPAAAGGGAAAGVMALFGPGFGSAATALAILLVVPAVLTVGSVQRHALLAADRPLVTSGVAIAKMIVTAAATVSLVLWIGMEGAAIGMLAGAIVEVLWFGRLMRAHLSAPLRSLLRVREVLALGLAYGAGFVVARVVQEAIGGVAGLVPALLAGSVAFVAALVAGGGVGPRDRERFAGAWSAVARRARNVRSRTLVGRAAGRSTPT